MTLTDLENLRSRVLRMSCYEFEMWLEEYGNDIKEGYDAGYNEGYSHGHADGANQ